MKRSLKKNPNRDLLKVLPANIYNQLKNEYQMNDGQIIELVRSSVESGQLKLVPAGFSTKEEK